MCKAVCEMNEKAAEKSRPETLWDAVVKIMKSLKVETEDAMCILEISKDAQITLIKII